MTTRAPRVRSATGGDALLSIDSLTRRHGSRIALDAVTLEVKRGETLGVLGTNGAGKTTLIHALAGIAKADRGSIRFADGAEPSSAAARRRIGVAFQELAIYPELEAIENVRFFAGLYGLSGRDLDEAVDEALVRVGLEDRRHAPARTLSGGMQRRLNLACAIAHRPELLLLDEPTAALDARSRERLIDELSRVALGGTTVVLSTHHLEEVERLCDRVAILDNGRLVALGTPESLAREHGSGLCEVDLERIDEGSARPRSVRLRWLGAHPVEDASRLIRSGERIKRLHVEVASLETAFHVLTGKVLEE